MIFSCDYFLVIQCHVRWVLFFFHSAFTIIIIIITTSEPGAIRIYKH